MAVLKAVALVEAGVLVAAITEQLNTYLNLFTILLVVLAAIPVARSRRNQQTIRDLDEALKAKTALAEERGAALRQHEQACQHLKTEAAEWRARYEEQAKYTAAEAVAHFEQVIEEHRQQVAERHAQLLTQGQQTAAALGEITNILRARPP